MKIATFIALLAAFLCSTHAWGQKKDEIDYYTDSDVKRSIASLQLGYMPYFGNRRVLNETTDPSVPYFFTNTDAKAKFGQGIGGDLLFGITQNFQVGIGFYSANMHYRWQGVSLTETRPGGVVDTLGINRWDVNASYLVVPIQFGFVTQIQDQWWLQVYPALEVSFVQSLNYEYVVEGQTAAITLDKKQDARDNNMAINFGLGGEFRPVPKIGIFARAQFRYFFFPNIEDELITEVPYTIGAHIGARFYF